MPGWTKCGLLLAAPPPRPWSRSHAALPCIDRRRDGIIDLYYSPRDDHGRAHVARAQLVVDEISGELSLVGDEDEPVLAPGPLGAFDESGTTVSCVVSSGGRTFLYYTGWTLGVSVPFYFFGGVAVRSGETGAFERLSDAPMLERSKVDPYLTASPWVLPGEDGPWRMWYVSAAGWRIRDGAPQHRYNIRYAESEDGLSWRREGLVSIDFADDEEYALSRPCVVRDGDRYRMWFAARGPRYELGYAESEDGVHWTREDVLAGLDPAQEGWDSEMVEYPAVFDEGSRRYMLYNGNGYGASGIGYAIAAAPA